MDRFTASNAVLESLYGDHVTPGERGEALAGMALLETIRVWDDQFHGETRLIDILEDFKSAIRAEIREVMP